MMICAPSAFSPPSFAPNFESAIRSKNRWPRPSHANCLQKQTSSPWNGHTSRAREGCQKRAEEKDVTRRCARMDFLSSQCLVFCTSFAIDSFGRPSPLALQWKLGWVSSLEERQKLSQARGRHKRASRWPALIARGGPIILFACARRRKQASTRALDRPRQLRPDWRDARGARAWWRRANGTREWETNCNETKIGGEIGREIPRPLGWWLA